jgi:germination protein M
VALALVLLGPLAGPASAKTTTTDVRLYFLVDGKIAATTRAVETTPAIATATLAALFAGPQVNELAIGQRTALPASLALADPLKIDQSSKIATISLPSNFVGQSKSGEMQRSAQIVYTLTQFSTVTAVSFVIDGAPYKALTGDGKRADGPVGRADYEALVPAILFESAAGNPLHVTGTANVFEAEFRYELYDAGNQMIANGNIMASSGTGTRGTFTSDISYKVKTNQTGTLVGYEPSAKDGSRTNVVAVPVLLTTTPS